MNHTIVIGGILTLIVCLLLFGARIKPIRFIGMVFVKLAIGALLLFVVNMVGIQFDFHLPINVGTTVVSGLLGLPGLFALIIIKLYIIPS
ncbi:pro-sigmaK processing inhibitor BofA family protein [Bacillus manliponensis]|uniref:pro-sigmaK processing inhibitor BofA family protein n=1 Tax=Bacillus manliponensis TaxID=574376 RepID=UPI0035128E77